MASARRRCPNPLQSSSGFSSRQTIASLGSTPSVLFPGICSIPHLGCPRLTTASSGKKMRMRVILANARRSGSTCQSTN